MKTRRNLIEDAISDLVSSFVCYDRKEDSELQRGDIEEAVKFGEITIDDMIDQFSRELRGRLK